MNRLRLRVFVPVFAALALATLPFASVARQDEEPTKATRVRPKAQSVLASKTATFATVPATDPAVKNATDAGKLDAVKKLLDTDATIIGTVAEVYAPKSNKVVMLNFAEEHWKAANVAVKARNFAKFPALKTLSGKKIIVTGRVTDFDDKPQIEVSALSQIKIVKE